MALMDSSGRFLFASFNSSFKCPNCSEFCFYADPSCVFPPIPPLYPDSDNTTTQTKIGIQRPSHLLPAFLIAAGALLALSFFVLLAFYAVLKRGRRLRRQSLALPLPPQEEGAADDDDAQRDGGSTHHVWLIRTVGLDESIIGSITTTAYRSRPGGGECCAVCLGEFKDGETVKLLPRCTHSFHVSCVDTWLRSHVNCPLCRAPVLVAAAATDPEVPEVAVDGSDSHLDVPAAPISLEDESEASTSSSSELPKEMGDDGFQPVRRSVSMDSSLLQKAAEEPSKRRGELIPRMELELSVVSDHKALPAGTASLKGEEEGPLAMKRSQSTRSGRFFLPRYGRFRNPILPL
ncbi:putative E3 ubiquitin-protein ligase RING1-like [Iris pallida]|uniref:RING-type E3 ubiquitin transferase n=1 Tax=Iris pallida TaxID=29817 RepID=A0AAX6GZ67_IRIPA|nr:putative E3 ubiquitin-protein ligase RING1-like [Iris pallida]